MSIARMPTDHITNIGLCIQLPRRKGDFILFADRNGVRAMYRIVHRELLTHNAVFMRLEASEIASSAHACQFVIIGADETGGAYP